MAAYAPCGLKCSSLTRVTSNVVLVVIVDHQKNVRYISNFTRTSWNNMSSSKYPTLSLTQAAAMFAGKLVTDFVMTRVGRGWAILLTQVGGEVSALRPDIAVGEYSDNLFDTADQALYAAYRIGFDVGRVGIWRPPTEQTETLLHRAMDTLRDVTKRR